MPPYLIPQDYVNAYGQRELDQLTNAANGAEFNSALADAEAILNGWIAHLVPVPLAYISVRMRRATLIIVRYLLHKQQVTQRVMDDFEAEEADIKGMKSAANLGLNVTGTGPVTAGDGIVADGAGSAEMMAETSVFARGDRY